MATKNTQSELASNVLYGSGIADILIADITEIYCRELKAARDRTISQAKGMIAAQLKRMPINTFGIELSDKDLEVLAHNFLPTGLTFDLD